jgi:hypothetical protein
MREWCIASGFNITKSFSGEDIDPSDFDFHITVFYSDNKKYVANGTFSIDPIELKFLRFELLGQEKNVPTILIDKTHDLVNIRKIYETTGLKDSWPEWKPHLSVSYSYKGKPLISKVGLPDFKVTVDTIVVKNQKKG